MNILITGATGGIGGALARQLAAQGARLILQGRGERLRALCGDLGARALELDLTRPEAFAPALKALELDHLDALVHNAGVVELGTIGEQDHHLWTHTLAVNTVAPAELTRLLLPALRAAQGSVVFVNSGAGQRANAGWASYAASKFALRALADALRDEEAGHGVRVSTVYPGRTATDMQRKVREQEGGAYEAEAYLEPETVAGAIAAVLACPRDAVPAELVLRPAVRP